MHSMGIPYDVKYIMNSICNYDYLQEPILTMEYKLFRKF